MELCYWLGRYPLVKTILRYWVPAMGIRVPNIECRVPTMGCRAPTLRCQIQTTGLKISSMECRVPTMGYGVLAMGIRGPIIKCRVSTIAGCYVLWSLRRTLEKGIRGSQKQAPDSSGRRHASADGKTGWEAVNAEETMRTPGRGGHWLWVNNSSKFLHSQEIKVNFPSSWFWF